MIERALRPLLCVCFVLTAASAASDPFVGDWKLNASRSALTDRMKVTSAGGDKYTFDFGGGPETIAVDGTDQPSPLPSGGTLSVTRESDSWKVVRKTNGRTIISAVWRLSSDGLTLTDHFTGFNADGSSYILNYAYKRTAPGSGFAGTWVSTSLQAVNYVIAIQLRSYEEHGLAIIDSASQFTGNVNFAASAVRRLDEHTLELMRTKKDGELTEFLRLELSPDLRTLTMTPPSVAGTEPRRFVFDRQ